LSSRAKRNKSIVPANQKPLAKDDESLANSSINKQEINISHWQGPLPPPETLEKYDQIVPGMSERLLDLFEKQAKHRMQLEKDVVHSNIVNTKKGQWFAFILSILIVITAACCAYIGQSNVAIALVGFDVAGLASAFCFNQYLQKKERKEKREKQ